MGSRKRAADLAGCDRLAVADLVGHVFACLLWIVVIHLLWAWGMPSSAPSCLPQRHLSGAYEEGIAGMLTIVKASLLGSALMLLTSCTGYLTNYQTPCVQGHICECVQYTALYRSWLDCRDYGRVKSPTR
jgi:hypothetical protein